ncbi:MAG: Holliday junction resolvase RuvX [Planctomycetota bacterium]|jgi:putative Holliday junction resolvase|nr:MAG: Holliday junction resolvase RuvX [Planctomycetota bacterium]RLS96708.1 MAG: Holliday junction resolvase RuvX [Planctomycetota bacterium]
MRYLCIDLGDKRTGFACGDDVLFLVQPLLVAEAPSREAQLVTSLKMIEEYGPDRVVLGMPFNMDGSEGPRAKLTREFGDALLQRLPPRTRVTLVYQDERLSSFAAEEKLNRTGRTHGEKKALRDALAACAILEDFLRAARNASSAAHTNIADEGIDDDEHPS